MLDTLIRRATSAQTVYLEECANVRRELAEALELSSLLLEVSTEDLVRAVDVGCGHGLTSFFLAASRTHLCPVWVDRAPGCRAARFADQLGIEWVPDVGAVRRDKAACLVLAVNVCGESLLEVIRWYNEFEEARVLLCVPCCGIGEYAEWVARVEAALGSVHVRRFQLKHNLKRTALLHTKP